MEVEDIDVAEDIPDNELPDNGDTAADMETGRIDDVVDDNAADDALDESDDEDMVDEAEE